MIIGTRPIVTDSLDFSLDAGSVRCYSGSSAKDIITGNGITIQNTASHSYNDGSFFRFDVAFDCLLLDTPATTTASFHTLDAWFRRDDTVGQGYRTIMANTTGNFHHMLVRTGSSTMTVFDGGIREFSPSYVAPADGKFHHYTYVFEDGVECKLYVDGVYIGVTATTMDLGVNRVGRIGNWSSGSYECGEVGIVNVWSKELTAAEILNNYNALKDRYK